MAFSHAAIVQFSNSNSIFYSLFVLLGVGGFFQLLRVYRRLRHIPGPFWAKFTDLQRVLWVQTQRAHEIHQAAHEKYGDVVRFGPNMVSLADPDWIETLYSMRRGFPKVSIHTRSSYPIWLPYLLLSWN